MFAKIFVQKNKCRESLLAAFSYTFHLCHKVILSSETNVLLLFIHIITREILMKKLFVTGLLLASTALSMAATPAQAGERFWVENRTDSSIKNVYAVRGDRYSRDMLGDNGMIVPGDAVFVLRSGWKGCRHNLVLLTEDGGTVFFRNFNTCEGPLYVHSKALQYD